MNFKGRNIDPIELWSRYVDFSPTMNVQPGDEFLDKVVCPNPGHDATNRHFQINALYPTVHCFTYCGISGTYEHAIAILEGLYDKFDCDLDVALRAMKTPVRERSVNEKEQVRRADRARRQAGKLILKQSRGFHRGIPTTTRTPRPTPVISPDALSFESFLPPVAMEYLESRGITGNSIAAWNIGWLPSERRIVIPARDETGHLRFLVKRAVSDRQQPKYLYTEGFPKTAVLFGACQIDLGMVKSRGLVLVEGSLDTVKNHQNGLRNTVGILGTGLSEKQRRIIARLRPPKIFLFFDRDQAGVRNIEIAEKLLKKYPLYVCLYPKGKDDPGSLTKREANRSIERAISLRQFHKRLNDKLSRKEMIPVG